MEYSTVRTDGPAKAARLATELQNQMDSRLADLKSSQLAAQNQMNSVLESLKAFQPLIMKVKEQEQSLSLQGQHIEELKHKLFEQERMLSDKSAEARTLAVGLAEARAYRDELRADQEAKGTEIFGLRSDLDNTKDSLKGMDAHLLKVMRELASKTEEVKVNAAEVWKLQELLDFARAESRRLLESQAKERKEWSDEQRDMKRVIAQISEVEETNRQLRLQLDDLGATHTKLQEEMGNKLEALNRLEINLQIVGSERNVNALALKRVEAHQQATSGELEEMRRMCGAMEDQWGEERGKLVEELAITSAQLGEARNDLQTCTERLETSMAEAKLLTALKDLLKEEGDKRVAESKLSMQRQQLRNSARLYVADYHRKMAEAAIEVASDDAHRERARHAAEEKALRGELEKVKQEVIRNEHQLKQLQMEGLRRWQTLEKSNLNGSHIPSQLKPPLEDNLIPGIDEPMLGVEVIAPVEAKMNGKPPVVGHKHLNGAAHIKQHAHASGSKAEIDAMKKANRELIAERDQLARKLEQSTRDGISERTQLLQALQAAKADADALKRENKMNSAQVGSLNERATMLEKELVDLKKTNSYNTLAPNHAATAMRFRELEERSREAERRLRDAVEENVDLRERIESCEEVEMALRAAKEMLKSAEMRVREAVEENSDLRKRLYKW